VAFTLLQCPRTQYTNRLNTAIRGTERIVP